MDKNNALDVWLANHCVKIMRFFLAFMLAWIFSLPLMSIGDKLINLNAKNLEAIFPITEITTITIPKQNDSADKSQQACKQKDLSETKYEKNASPRVWVYGLQLITWAGVLAMLFWAIVALCREE